MIFTCSTVASCSALAELFDRQKICNAPVEIKIHRENLEFPCEGCEVNYAVSCKRRGIVAMETSLVVLDDNVWDRCSSQVFLGPLRGMIYFCRFFHASKSWNERRGSWTSLAFGAFRDFAADLLIFLPLCKCQSMQLLVLNWLQQFLIYIENSENHQR